MKKRFLILTMILAVLEVAGQAQDATPLKLLETFKLSPDIKGNFDHFAIDLKTNRLFATPEGYKAVLVFDVQSGKLIHTIRGIEKPHAILCREDLHRLYVTDGEAGELKIFDSTNYALVSYVKLLLDADSIGFDRETKLLYIDNGGGDVHRPGNKTALHRQRRRRRPRNLLHDQRCGDDRREKGGRHESRWRYPRSYEA